MSTPFFSIVLPTKNRSEILSSAIESVLMQSFVDWELVIIDNDDSDATRVLVQRYHDRRIRYVRTGGLAMWANWEKAFREANGEYILLLEDKLAIKRQTLEYLHNLTIKAPTDLYSWKVGSSNHDQNNTSEELSDECEIETIPSRELLEEFVLNVSYEKYWLKAPKGLNSMLSRSLHQKIIHNYGRLCSKHVPDFSMSYHQLLAAESFVHINRCLYHYSNRSAKYSNGASYRLGNKKSVWGYMGAFDAESIIGEMPCRSKQSVNLVLADFWALNRDESWGFKMSDLALDKYFVSLWRELVHNKYLYKAKIKFDLLKWQSAFCCSNLSNQAKISTRKECEDIEQKFRRMVVEKNVQIVSNAIHWRIKRILRVFFGLGLGRNMLEHIFK